MPINYGSLPFDNAVEFFQGKLNLPTAAWTDIWEGMHARAFTIAGAMREELLVNLREAVQSAIESGTTLQQFRKDFDRIADKHGWGYKGGRNWRTRVIYETNLRQAYNTGREKQMQDPKLRKFRPYGLYKHNDTVEHPCPKHLAWDNLVLPLDDPWWETHTPQNGWGCKCKKMMVGERDLKRMGLNVTRQAPPIEWEQKTVGIRGPSPRVVRVPKGIDAGFAYNPGTAAWGRQLADETMEKWRKLGGRAYKQLTPGNWNSYGRTATIPLDTPHALLGTKVKDRKELQQVIKQSIGGETHLFTAPGSSRYPVHVDAVVLANHIQTYRSQYVPFLAELLTDPFEIWQAFEQHQGTGKVELRHRFIKRIATGKKEGVMLVAQAVKGQLEAWTFIPGKPGYVHNQRVGKLLWGRDE